MSVMSTKAGVKSRYSDNIQFIPASANSDVMSKQPYGSLTISEYSKGIEFPNVQSAINDVRNFTIRPINSIEINTDGVSPEGVSQTDTWTFTGTVVKPDGGTGDAIISVFGFPVTATVGDTAEEFTAKAKLVLEDAVLKNFIINTVSQGSTGAELTVSYIDNQTHVLQPETHFGITVSSTIISPAKPGYGAWTRIGTKTETLEGSATPVLLHYFKRLA
ncbi:baseplate wedge subunit [Salmonella phage vB_SnwM_CGG4-1]|uniref:Baseplate wedge subunit and tail pin II n=1 Tax=Salmonella phage vB_SnwM_CGG4-1 TaxID=1815631 RepID=A0A1B0VVE4_9CAUD|nr:baseplate wedge subunit [Salmonella phage vB_SnwM_CGG4-1]ANA49498.1 baseplate wedge subunit and tail pin II [Salmonella phage vB_SnwM_CGG4-1]